MYSLVERGHVYIAQPPLYKLKAGKQETYIKDDREMEEWQLRAALEDAELVTATGQPPLIKAALSHLVRDYSHLNSVVQRLSRHYDADLLEQLRKMAPVPTEAAALETWIAAFVAALNDGHSASRYKVKGAIGAINDNGGTPLLSVERRLHGLEYQYSFGEDFFASVDYQQMVRFNQQTANQLGEGASIGRGERTHAVTSFQNVYEWLMSETRRGLNIQRYKGLGEMNPGQLWETTLDPTVRRLVRVQVEDVVAADQIFTTLMGEDVEPRRDFIERNSLLVSNLDV
jgi:DNA gyrase subunit B